MTEYRVYTPAEKRRRLWLTARGAKQAIAGVDAVNAGINRELDQIEERAADRGAHEAAALIAQNETAKNELAAARAAERAAHGDDRRTAKQARQKAEDRVRDTERAIRRAGL